MVPFVSGASTKNSRVSSSHDSGAECRTFEKVTVNAKLLRKQFERWNYPNGTRRPLGAAGFTRHWR